MTRVRYEDAELVARYDAGARAYKRDWLHIDEMIRKVVSENCVAGFPHTHTKIVLIDGVYRSQLTRSIGRRAHVEVAEKFVNDANMQVAMDRISAKVRLCEEVILDVLEAHHIIMSVATSAIPAGSDAKDLRSFASKYLHFHVQIAPIYDSIASGNISRFTGRLPTMDRIRDYEKRIPASSVSDGNYRWYLIRFLALMEHLKSLGRNATVKEVDHMLMIDRRNP
jgi:hypothetical protein